MKTTILVISATFVFAAASCEQKKTPPVQSQTPEKQSPQPAAQPARTNSLKAPLDRTRAVREQVKARNGEGEF